MCRSTPRSVRVSGAGVAEADAFEHQLARAPAPSHRPRRVGDRRRRAPRSTGRRRVADSCSFASRKPIDSTGQRSATRWQEATSVPGDSYRRRPEAPSTRRADGELGQRHDQRPESDEQPRLAQLGAAQPAGLGAERRAWLRCRPNALMIRMPSTDSSTTVARSPPGPARRAAREYRASKTEQTSPAARMAAQHQPEPRAGDNRTRSRAGSQRVHHQEHPGTRGTADLRSDVARDSSCPEAQRSWKATGSRCRCPYRSARIAASTGQRPRHQQPAQQDQPGLDGPERQHAEDEPRQGAEVAVGDGAVDDRTGDERDRQARQSSGKRGDTAADQCGAVGADVGHQPAKGAEGGSPIARRGALAHRPENGRRRAGPGHANIAQFPGRAGRLNP